jgi:hypothetical protein
MHHAELFLDRIEPACGDVTLDIGRGDVASADRADFAAYGAPISPDVNAKAIVDQRPLERTKDGAFATELSITDRGFGLGVDRVPELGKNVVIAVLRSET